MHVKVLIKRDMIGGCQDRCHLNRKKVKPLSLPDVSGWHRPFSQDSARPDPPVSSFVFARTSGSDADVGRFDIPDGGWPGFVFPDRNGGHQGW